MPRPIRIGGPPMMVAVVNPTNVYSYAKRGMHIQTTPLSGNQELLLKQVENFRLAQSETQSNGDDLTLTLSRVAFVSRTDRDRRRHIEKAYSYYSRFDNIFTGPGIVDAGMIRPLPRDQTMGELAENLLVCTAAEMVDRLAPYAELGIDRMVLNINFGVDQSETLDCIQNFSEEVMPHFCESPTSESKSH